MTSEALAACVFYTAGFQIDQIHLHTDGLVL
jgi:hypothetical protein